MAIKLLTTMRSLATILLAVTLIAAAESENLQGIKDGTMMKDTAVFKTGIPPIDSAAPAKTETATFALG